MPGCVREFVWLCFAAPIPSCGHQCLPHQDSDVTSVSKYRVGQTLGYHPSYEFFVLFTGPEEFRVVLCEHCPTSAFHGRSDWWLRAWGRPQVTGGPGLGQA